MYHNNKCKIKIRSKFCNTKGLLQRCPLSPRVFKVCTNRVLREWSRKCELIGLKTGKDCYIHNLLFADDQVGPTQGGTMPTIWVEKQKNMRNGV